MQSIIKQELNEHLTTLDETTESIGSALEVAANICIDSLKQGGKILIFGNGGSAADAQHIAAELVGRYKLERKGLSAIALSTDTSSLTAIANDYGYEHVFDRQIEALANPEDVAVGISTSGNSSNVINALQLAKNIGCKSIGLSGKSGGDMNKLCDVNLVIPAKDTARIQEMHILVGHIICHLIELEFRNSK
jgi:D-sedoheptulose 7-phosphate isomerase